MGNKKKGQGGTANGGTGNQGKSTENGKLDFAGVGARPKYTPPIVFNMDTSTENELEWHPVQGKEAKRKRHSTSGEQKLSLSVDEKLDCILGKLSSLAVIEKKVGQLDRKLSRNLSDVKEIRADIKEFELKIKSLEYKAIDQEARGRRNNLLFWGIDEAKAKETEDCELLAKTFIKSDLHVASDSMIIQRVHRLGAYRTGKTRPIIACFRDYKDVELIMKHVTSLKGSKKSVGRDFPNEINAARKMLYPKLKLYKANPDNKVSIQYPAKLVVNGTTVDDAFPNWFHFLHRRYENEADGNRKSSPQHPSLKASHDVDVSSDGPSSDSADERESGL